MFVEMPIAPSNYTGHHVETIDITAFATVQS